MYRKVSNLRRTLVGNKIVDNSDVVGASPVGAAPTDIFILNLTHGFNGLGKDNCKTRWETIMFWDWVRLILENWRYIDVILTGWGRRTSQPAKVIRWANQDFAFSEALPWWTPLAKVQ